MVLPQGFLLQGLFIGFVQGTQFHFVFRIPNVAPEVLYEKNPLLFFPLQPIEQKQVKGHAPCRRGDNRVWQVVEG